MSADITDSDGIVARAEYTNDGYLVDEIERVDLSELQFEDNDNWLYIPSQCSTESAIHDLYAWLKTEPELDTRGTRANNINKKCINTRTFTRSKKRSARLSFESIFEGLPPSPSSNVWNQNTDVTQIKDAGKHLPVTIEGKESVPPMLKPSIMTATNNFPGETLVISGQESMEAFLNLSQSKGIDSFINLGEPEFNDLLMNVSQPSLMYTSVTSFMNDSTFMKNDTMQMTNAHTAKRSSDVEEKSNSNSGNETFVMQSANNRITLDTAYCTNSSSNTVCKELVQPDLNETYNAEAPVEASALWSNLNKEETSLSSTFLTEPNVDVNFAQLQNEANNDVKPLDVTYLSSPKDAEGQNLTVSIESDTYKPTMRANTADLNMTCDILSDNTAVSATQLAPRAGENVLNISFKVPTCNQSTPMNPNMLNPTSKLAMKHSEQPRQTLYSTLKAPTSLRRELLAEIQRSGERRLDSTYTNIPSDHPGLRDTKENIHIACNENETDISPSNRYHTYRKSTLMAATNQYRNQRDAAMTAQKELPVDQRKFYTFTKKSNNLVKKTDLMASNENTEMRPSLDSMFRKPLPPNAQKRNLPKTLSKLPQFLQKSNPNLVSSSLKTVGGVSVSRLSSVGYIKGSQPNIAGNIAEKSPSKLHPYGKLRSGSEQRLVDADANSQFPMKGMAAGSTESIESTQSAHSAPDLDDRLSTCSDSSSHNSCKHTMDINQLHQLVRMQEESLKQDVMPKLSRRVLENTWIEEKTDLPSPILKNGVGHGETDRHFLNTDTSMKCSSPLESFTESSHALNNDGNPEANIAKSKSEVEKTESPNQIMPKNENKTRLKQPTNWNAGSKPATVMSGIPRPASRIPALRFARPSAKTTEADLKKRPT
ncbi:uncharacterized protein [Linepithema humile]|uniref:uncharacterized protein isoform X1 n=1 Tax=Linepithema humile TaxID=83485 RepID=UPI00351F7A01